MDKFILENDTWLRYLPMIIYALIVIIAVLLIIIVVLVLKKNANKSLRSQKRKSPFAAAYADCFAANASSTAPLKRGPVIKEPEMNFSNVVAEPRSAERANAVPPPPPPPVAEVNPVYHPEPEPVYHEEPESAESRVVDLYFEFEDEFRL